MKRSTICIFLFSVLALLALLSMAFPSGGLKIAGLELRFPTLKSVFLGSEEETVAPDPVVLLAERHQAAVEAEQDRFEVFFDTDPARIHFPAGQGPEYFDPLFAALESAMQTPVRIIHYGDSQIEEDRISSELRLVLQQKFGGSGQGYVPIIPYYSLTSRVQASAGLERYSAFGRRLEDASYGPFADLVRLDTTMTLTFSALKRNYERRSHFDRITLLSGGDSTRFAAGLGSRRVDVTGDGSLDFTVFELPDSCFTATLALSGYGDIYGVLLDSDKGVRLDNVAMRGNSGDVFTKIPMACLSDFIEHENVQLIILQYGGNSVPHSKSSKAISVYMSIVRSQLARLKRVWPEARLLFIGPSDMATRIDGVMQTYPILPEMVDSLRNTVLSEGAAYWDLYSAMGGRNSMKRWVESSPALAGSDHVHFTPLGAEKVADMLADSFFLYYDYYLWRKDND